MHAELGGLGFSVERGRSPCSEMGSKWFTSEPHFANRHLPPHGVGQSRDDAFKLWAVGIGFSFLASYDRTT